MARSKKKNPIHGITTAQSEKEDKRFANRAYRRKVKQMIQPDEIVDDLTLPQIREISNVWDFAKDGKLWKAKDYWIRHYLICNSETKDDDIIEEIKKMMRK